MSFIKTGDGQIVSVIIEKELTDKQKKNIKKLKQNKKTSEENEEENK